MSLVDEVRTDIQQDIFDVIGKTVTLINKSTPIYNTRGEVVSYTSNQTDIIGVPYNIMWDRKDSQPFGDMNAGDMALFVPYTVTVKIDDEIIVESEYYKVVEIQKHFIPDNVATLLRITKIPDVVEPEDE